MKSTKTLEFKFERTIPAPPGKVFAGWLNPEILGTPWHEADMLILNPKVGGFFYLFQSVYPHLRAIYKDRTTGSNPAYLGVAEHPRTRVDGYCDLQEIERKHPDDPRAFRPPR